MPSEWEELRIRLWAVGPGRYYVLANGPASASAVIKLPNPGSLTSRWHQLLGEEFGEVQEEAASTDSRNAEPVGNRSLRLQSLGRELFGILFPPAVRDCLGEALHSSAGKKRRLRLRFSLPKELAALPLEVLCAPADHPLQFLAQNHNLSVVRSIDVPPTQAHRHAGAGSQIGLELLIAAPCPEGEAPLGEADEIARLQADSALSIHDVFARRAPRPFAPGPVTRNRFSARLAACDARGAPWALLLIAHGKQGSILLEREDGRADEVNGVQLGAMLGRLAHLQLVVLELCRGAETASLEPYSGVAQSLLAAGVPAVVAMKTDVSDTAAGRFSPAFLHALAQGETIDGAVWVGRDAMHGVDAVTDDGSEMRTTIEWTTPACLIREGQGTPAPPGEPQQALAAYQGSGRTVESIVHLARFCRSVVDWEGFSDQVPDWTGKSRWEVVAGLCREGLQVSPSNEELLALQSEAAVEQYLKKVGETCAKLHAPTYFPIAALRKVPEACKPLADEIKLWRSYWQARQAEQAQDWPGALEIYDQDALADYGDVPRRRPYVSGREKELNEDWAGAAEGYRRSDLTLYPDCRSRATYCDGRRYEKEGLWEQAKMHYGRLPHKFLDADSRYSYCTGRLLERARRYQDALDTYARIDDPSLYPDMEDRRRNIEAHQAESAGDWLLALQFLLALSHDFLDVEHRVKRILTTILLQAEYRPAPSRARDVPMRLALAAAGRQESFSGVFVTDSEPDPSRLSHDGPVDATPTHDHSPTPHAPISVQYARMEFLGKLHHFESHLHASTVEGKRGADLMDRLSVDQRPGPGPWPPGDPRWKRLASLHPSDGRHVLRSTLEDQLDLRVDPAVCHNLMLFHLAESNRCLKRGLARPAIDHAELAIAYAAATLVDADYLSQFAAPRAAWCKVLFGEGELVSFVALIERRLTGFFHLLEEHLRGARQHDLAERAAQLPQLLRTELRGARLVRQLGGLRPSSDASHRVGVGPLFVRMHERGDAFAALLAEQALAGANPAVVQELKELFAPAQLAGTRSVFDVEMESELGDLLSME